MIKGVDIAMNDRTPVTILDIENAGFAELCDNGGKDMSIKKNDHEQLFKLMPVGVRYICEFCGEGEMETDPNSVMVVPLPTTGMPMMRTHKCNKCGKTMQLPKTYPYIEWISAQEYQHLMNMNMILDE